MKDNQMKQAELLIPKLLAIINNLGPYMSAVQNQDISDAVSFIRAKLTTSQVSEPIYQVFIESEGWADVSAEQYKTFEEWIHKRRVYTTPQEAILPAITEYIKRLESALKLTGGNTPIGKQALASKPTGLE